MIKRLAIFAYGLVCYAIFFATFLYALGFVGNFLVPRAIDGAPRTDFTSALLVDLGLLGLFAVQHSVMARPAFKSWFTRLVPESAERSTYVLFSSLALIALFAGWQPLGGVLWEVTDPVGRIVLYSLFGFGWGLVLVSTFLINHFDLFGLRQVWLQLRGRPYTHLKFGTPGPYNLVRHPLYLGWFFAFWATPVMTATHLLFALMTTAYILVAIQLEERDLVNALGDDYRRYRERVPMVIPFLKRRTAPLGGAPRTN
ncbi:MAG TPA: isoprenylcysteine carboxylmethyltransferase family protein [Steroidobacteraceae bacterium]|nr:isoprenylcysteine carboxylmethyltransferase family protein [Steroidobacteraceae bacterium]